MFCLIFKKTLPLYKYLEQKQTMSNNRYSIARTFRIRAQSMLRNLISVFLQPSIILRVKFLLSFFNQDYDADGLSASITHYKKTSMDLNKKQAIYLIVFFLLSVVNAFGQSIHLSGRILQQKKQTPVEFATVILFRQDSVFLKGTTTDSIGRFEFENLQMENYVLSVSCLGFETKRILIQNLAESAQMDKTV